MPTKSNFLLKAKLGFILILTLLCSQTFAQKVMKTYYDYYNLKLKAEWQIDKDGFKNGYYKSYFQNKMPFEVGQYKNDFKTGIWKEFEADGKLKLSENYKEGKKDGLAQMWENGTGFHRLIKEAYYDTYGAYREIQYYTDGAVQSDIRRDGECKIFYGKDMLAETWQNQDAKTIPSTIKIWTKEGEPFPLQKIINGVSYKIDSDVEYDWSGEKSGQIGYYITPPTIYTADSAGWTIKAYGGEYRYASTLPKDQWNGTSLRPAGYVYGIEKEKADTIIEMTYLSKESGGKLLWDLKFLNNSNTYLSEVVKYAGKNPNGEINTTKINYDADGKAIKQENGVSVIYRGQNGAEYRFTPKESSVPDKSIGSLSISYSDEPTNIITDLGMAGLIKGKVNNSNYSFEYHYNLGQDPITYEDKINELLIFKNGKKYLTAKISLVNVIPERVKDNWFSAQSPNIKSDNELSKCLELLDNSPQSFFYYASDLQLYNENSEIVASLKKEKGGSAYSYSPEALENSPILKSYKSASSIFYLQIKPDNKQIIDQLNLLNLLSSSITFDTKQSKGLLRNANMDFGQELLAFATTYKQ